MNRKIHLLIILSVCTFPLQAEQVYDACVFPETPAIPVGTVTEEQLLAAVSNVKNYQMELEEFRTCLDQLKVAVDEESMNEESVKKNKKFNAGLDAIYNLSVDREQAVVDQLNSQIRKYKTNQANKKNEPGLD